MKLRIRGNSIRIRLNQTEVKNLLERGQLIEEVMFGSGDAVLSYSLEGRSQDKIQARFLNNRICISLPVTTLRKWALSDEVSLKSEQELQDGKHLKILIERDFKCLNPSRIWEEDEADNFPNPNPSCGE
jgi:hypothetical protein